MTQEEKARAYDNAIEAARCIYNNMKEGGNFGGMEDLSVIFPELQESNGEQIRKQILSFLKEFEHDHYRSLDFSSWIDWLEKQDKQESVWSEKDNPYYDDICEILVNILRGESVAVNNEAIRRDLDWFTSIKYRV